MFNRVFLTIIFFFYFFCEGYSQDPAMFNYNIENGAPSNEIYCVMQDHEGYIWIGCDAGIYRFNGIRFEHFTSPELTARSGTGIIQSRTTRRIYAYNFNGQLLYIENDQLRVVKDWNRPVNGLADDGKGNIWITSAEGLFKLIEEDRSIQPVHSPDHIFGPGGVAFTSHGISNEDGSIYYQNANNIFCWKGNEQKCFRLEDKYRSEVVFLSRFSEHPWIISLIGDKIYRYSKGSYSVYTNKALLDALKGKKINCVFESTDGKIWIGTYTGLLCHDPNSQQTEKLYDQFSFSFGMQDSEGNFWFTTLHNGLLRIPNMQVRCWQSTDEKGFIEQFTHICTDRKNVFLGGTNGFVSVLEKDSHELKKYQHEPMSDLGTIYKDPIDNCLYFNKINNIFKFKAGKFELINSVARPIKSILHVPGGYFQLSSQGLFFTQSIEEPLGEKNMIYFDWYRDISQSPFSNSFFSATNNGLQELIPFGNTYKVGKKYLPEKQVISVTSDLKNKTVYFYCFDGGLYTIDQYGKIKKIRQLGDDFRVTQISFYSGRLFMPSNKGILVIDPKSGKEVLFDRYSGLSSNNIRTLAFTGDICWAAGESLQRIPLSLFAAEKLKPRILARRILINEKVVTAKDLIELNYNDKLSLIADGISYRSNGNFQFAYRINGVDNPWIKMPGTVEKIDFASLPTGDLIIELKLIDHAGNDSVNVIRYKLYVNPPFYQRWWFYLLIALSTLLLALGIFRMRLKNIKRKQVQELRRLRLENELRLTQQNTLKAQMNPHFLFNVLNSIKGYIYENDKKNAAKYLSDFSNLVRKVLELSSVPSVSLEQELQTLKLYIDLEAMLLQSDFEYSLKVDKNIDLSGVHVPALILQPYVENAFKHGLRHMSGPKRLTIQIHMVESEGLLTIEMTDNGIGRKAATKLNAQNKGEHQSFATSAMEKRIQLLNFEKKDVVGVEIRDNFEKEEPTGTTVIVRIHV